MEFTIPPTPAAGGRLSAGGGPSPLETAAVLSAAGGKAGAADWSFPLETGAVLPAAGGKAGAGGWLSLEIGAGLSGDCVFGWLICRGEPGSVRLASPKSTGGAVNGTTATGVFMVMTTTLVPTVGRGGANEGLKPPVPVSTTEAGIPVAFVVTMTVSHGGAGVSKMGGCVNDTSLAVTVTS